MSLSAELQEQPQGKVAFITGIRGHIFWEVLCRKGAASVEGEKTKMGGGGEKKCPHHYFWVIVTILSINRCVPPFVTLVPSFVIILSGAYGCIGIPINDHPFLLLSNE